MASRFRLATAVLSICALCACGGRDAAAPAASARLLAQAAASDYQRLVQMIYVGYFGRPADPAGLAYYAGLYAASGAPATLAGFSQAYGANAIVRQTIDDIASSQESRDLYPGDNGAFITAIYQNLFKRAPDSAGKLYWVQLLDAGSITRGAAALSIMAGALSSDAATVDNKATLAASFTAALNTPARVAVYSGMTANAAVRQVLQQVSTSADAVERAPVLESLVQTLLAAAPPAGAPGTPEPASVAAGDGLLVLPFSGPASGAAAVLGYTAICVSAGGTSWTTSPTSPVIVSGLANGVAQTCALQASNSAGAGRVSATVSATPRAEATTWAAPTGLSAAGLATASTGRAYLAFSAPARVNGALPAAYLASCSANGETRYGYAATSPIVVEGLRHGAQYGCTVQAFNGGAASAAASAAIPQANPNRLRYLYAIPADRSYNASWLRAMQASAADLQQWFKAQLGGPTFTLHAIEPQVCLLPGASAAYFSSNTWNTVASDLRTYCGVDYTRSDTDWIVYADVLHDVNTAGRLGAGAIGLAMFPRQDLEGLGGAPCTVSDEGVTWCFAQPRWVGGAGHEIAHTLGVPHPPACDAGLPSCDSYAARSIMWTGYADYPATYFVTDAKTILLNSRFIR